MHRDVKGPIAESGVFCHVAPEFVDVSKPNAHKPVKNLLAKSADAAA